MPGEEHTSGQDDTKLIRPPVDPPGLLGRTPRWVPRAVVLFWLGYLAMVLTRFTLVRLRTLILLLVVSLFLSFAIEPGVNRLVTRGWKRGRATATILLAVLFGCGPVRDGDRHPGRHAGGRPRAELRALRESHRRLPERQLQHQHRCGRRERRDQRSRRRRAALHPQPAGRGAAALGHRAEPAAAVVRCAVLHLLPRRRRATPQAHDLFAPGARPPEAGARHVGPGDPEDRRLPLLTAAAGTAVGIGPLGAAAGDRCSCARGARSVGGPGVAVHPGGRHLHRRHAAGRARVHRLAGQGVDRHHLHRHLPAGGELLARPAHHGADDGDPPGGRVRRGTGRCRAARRGRRDPRPADRGDGPGAGVELG